MKAAHCLRPRTRLLSAIRAPGKPPPSSMKIIFPILLAAFLAGCAAPPQVRIASSIIGRNVLHQAKDEMFGSGDTQTTGQETDQSTGR